MKIGDWVYNKNYRPDKKAQLIKITIVKQCINNDINRVTTYANYTALYEDGKYLHFNSSHIDKVVFKIEPENKQMSIDEWLMEQATKGVMIIEEEMK